MTFLKKYRAVLCLLLAAICVVTVLFGWTALQMDPRAQTVYIGDPTAVLYGQDGQKYVIAGGNTSILVLDANSDYVRSIPGGKQSQGFYYAQTLATDDAGNLYIHDRLLDDNGKNIASERIAVYDSTGAFVSYLYEEPHGDTNGENRVRIQGLTWQDGALWFVRVDMDSFTLCRLDAATGELTEQETYAYPEAYRYVMYCTLSSDFQVYFTDKLGSVWQAKSDGSHICLYDAADYGTDDFYSVAAQLACGPDGSIYFNDVGQREIRRILPDGTMEMAVGKGEPLADVPEEFNELPIYSFVDVTPEGILSAIYCEYYFDETLGEYVYDYCIYAEDAEGTVLLNTAEVEKAASVQVMGWLACAAIAVLAILLLGSVIFLIRGGTLHRLSAKGRLQMAVILAAVLSAALVASIVVDDLNQRYVEERTSKMTNMAVLMARDFDPEDIRSLDSPNDYGSEAYQRIDASVKEILMSEINDDGAYCTLYREMNGIVCIIYSDEGLNNVVYPMSGVFEGSYEAEIYPVCIYRRQ